MPHELAIATGGKVLIHMLRFSPLPVPTHGQCQNVCDREIHKMRRDLQNVSAVIGMGLLPPAQHGASATANKYCFACLLGALIRWQAPRHKVASS